MSLDKELTALE
jgi:hypothetical protein